MKTLKFRKRNLLYILLAVVFVLFSCNEKEMKTRIVKNEMGYYPQVKHYFTWKEIGKHPTGFGLYPKNDINYPAATKEGCEKIIKEYKLWYKADKKLVVVH